MIIEAIAKDSRNNNKEFNVLSIDYEKAFDSGEHWVLLKTLEFYKVPGKLIRVIHELLRNRIIELITPFGISATTLKPTRAIALGDALSVELFKIYVNPILQILEQSGFGYRMETGQIIPHVGFADDLSPISEDLDMTSAQYEIIKQTAQVERGLNVNAKKTKFASNRGNGKIVDIGDLKIENCE